jgi:hypothetical protein
MTRTVEQRQKSIEFNAHYVQRHAQFDDKEYKLFIYEMGIGFLEVQCVNVPKLKAKLEACAKFWKWFRNEFHIFEETLIEAYRVCEEEARKADRYCQVFTRELYISEMQQLFVDPSMDLAFSQLLTILKYGKH